MKTKREVESDRELRTTERGDPLACSTCGVEFIEPLKPYFYCENTIYEGRRGNEKVVEGIEVTFLYKNYCKNCLTLNQWVETAFSYVAFPHPSHAAYEGRRTVKRIAPASPGFAHPFSDIYVEAERLLDYSPRASAAISRMGVGRFLRMILYPVDLTGYNLEKQISVMAKRPNMSPELTEKLKWMGSVWGWVEYPSKITEPGLIVGDNNDGEDEKQRTIAEAKWNLDIMRELSNYIYENLKRNK